MQIGRVAQSTGLSVDTIRFYERESLIPPAKRTDAGYRVYDESTVDRLQLIGRAQSLGFSLQEIRELASRWGKIVARHAFGEAGPGTEVDLDAMEQVATAAANPPGVAEGDSTANTSSTSAVASHMYSWA